MGDGKTYAQSLLRQTVLTVNNSELAKKHIVLQREYNECF